MKDGHRALYSEYTLAPIYVPKYRTHVLLIWLCGKIDGTWPGGPKDHVSMGISHSGSKAPYKGDTRNHDPYGCLGGLLGALMIAFWTLFSLDVRQLGPGRNDDV